MSNNELDKEIKRIKRCRDIVIKILQKYQQARDNDWILIHLVMRELAKHDPTIRKYWPTFIPFSVLENWPPCETITRIRRDIQAQGKYPPSDNASAKRKRRNLIFRKVFAGEPDEVF